MELAYKELIDQQIDVVKTLSDELNITLDSKGTIDTQRALSITLGNLTKLKKMQRDEMGDIDEDDDETIALLERAQQQAKRVRDGKKESVAD